MTRLARPLVAARHRAARLQLARALRPHLHRRRQRRAPAGDDPPRAVRLLRALHRDPDRALRAASSRCGSRRCRRACCRSPTATTTTPREVAAALRAAGLRVEVDDRTESVGRKIREAELRKVPVHARRRRPRGRASAPSRCAATARATSGRCRSTRPSRGSRARSAAERDLALRPRRSRVPGACAARRRDASTAMVVIVDSCGSDVACGKYDAGHPRAGGRRTSPPRARRTALDGRPRGRRGGRSPTRRAPVAVGRRLPSGRRARGRLHRGAAAVEPVPALLGAARRRRRRADDRGAARGPDQPRRRRRRRRAHRRRTSDTLDGGPGADRIEGGAGDTLSFAGRRRAA